MAIEDLIKDWESKRDLFEEKFESHFKHAEDMVAVTLKGHLLAEEFLDNINRHCFHFPEYYDQADLTFGRKLLIAQAQVLAPDSSIFERIKKLNVLRNDLAHNLQSEKLSQKMNLFFEAVEAKYSPNFQGQFDLNKETDLKRIKMAISFILGELQLLDNIVEVMERSRDYGPIKG